MNLGGHLKTGHTWTRQQASRYDAARTSSHRNLTDGFYAFLQNLTVAMTGTTHSAA